MREYTLVPTQSAAASVTTSAIPLSDMTNYSFQVIFTGSDVAGSLKLQCSLNNVKFEDIPDSVQAVTASEGALYTVSVSSYKYARLVWTYSSGTGNITVLAATKDVLVKLDPVS